MSFRKIVSLRQCILIVLLCLGFHISDAQINACTTMGQTPTTAFPVCGTTSFAQASVPLCGGTAIPSQCNGSASDVNPFFYKFTCYTSGTLGFTITPNNLGDDYDWQLYDITNASSPNDIYTNASLFVDCDWSGTYGLTGAGPLGTSSVNCGSDPTAAPGSPGYQNPWATRPTLIRGHVYLLLISHFTSTQSGYSLSFGGAAGGTAVITDTTQPRLNSAAPANCGPTAVQITLDKQMLCSSLAADGSDFQLVPSSPGTPAPPAIISASGDQCNSGFDMTSLTLTFAGPLQAGNYTVTIRNGSDGNTLLDLCSNPIPVGYSVPLTVPPPGVPPPFDSLEPVGCAPTALTLVFSKSMMCSSVAADGSDFQLSGPGGILVSSAACVPGSPNSIRLQLSSPIDIAGAYQLTLVKGSDGNTLMDTCSQELPAGQTIHFSTADTVNALISYQVMLGCKKDTIDWAGASGNGINQWSWTFLTVPDSSSDSNSGGSTGPGGGGDGAQSASGENQQEVYTQLGFETAKLVVSNGTCSDSATSSVLLDNFLKAKFEATMLLCPNDKASFSDSSIGSIVSYNWIFGDGTGSNLQYPPSKTYPDLPQDRNYTVELIVSNGPGCFDTASQIVQVIANCYIAVPSAFTPNGDGINDYLYPLNAYKAVNLEFRVYNRFGQVVFQTTNWTIRWDGTVNGSPQPVGTYVWTLKYTNSETGEKVSQKGTTVLMR